MGRRSHDPNRAVFRRGTDPGESAWAVCHRPPLDEAAVSKESRMRSKRPLHLRVASVLGGAGLILAGCPSAARREAAPASLGEAVRTVESDSVTAPQAAPPRTGELIRPDDPDIQAALTAWKDTGQAPIIRKDDFLQY